jgi:hypothetical protein
VKRLLRTCPARELFGYLDDAARHPLDVVRQVVNDYLRSICGEEFTAKVFAPGRDGRRCGRDCVEIRTLRDADAKRQEKTSSAPWRPSRAGARPDYTPAVCRKCYVHPAILEFVSRARHDCSGGAQAAARVNRLKVEQRAARSEDGRDFCRAAFLAAAATPPKSVLARLEHARATCTQERARSDSAPHHGASAQSSPSAIACAHARAAT